MSYRNDPKLVISYGMPKSASTFAWMVIKKILSMSPEGVTTLTHEAKGTRSIEDYVTEVDQDRLAKIRDEAGVSHVVLKTHSPPSLISRDKTYFQNHIVFVQYRDPREISLSLIDHGRRSRNIGSQDFAECVDPESTLPIIDSAIDCARKWLEKQNSLPLSYDDLCFDTERSINILAARLGVELDPQDVLAEFSDKKQIIQFNKGTADRWRGEMTKEISDMFVDRYKGLYKNGTFQLTSLTDQT